jgi:hypothetical protein
MTMFDLITFFFFKKKPYFQPSPSPPAPFSINSGFGDPSFNNVQSSWALTVANSTDIIVFGKCCCVVDHYFICITLDVGAGLYSFFQVSIFFKKKKELSWYADDKTEL